MKNNFIILLGLILFLSSCINKKSNAEEAKQDKKEPSKIQIILDADANNELDDQHAMAYMFFNTSVFDILGITVNATLNGGDITQQYAEAKRVMQLCDVEDNYPLLHGANASFETILPTIHNEDFDGKDAVDFIISEARKPRKQKLVLAPIGKLTNIALALEIAPDIKDKIKIVWLGSNYPKSGEYNMISDIPSMNYVLEQDVDFEMVTVRYSNNTGSNGVGVSAQWIYDNMPSLGPQVKSVTGRHGGEFLNFGDYSVDLFKNIDLYGDPPSRALFDLVVLAILKNPEWGTPKEIPCPELVNGEWEERPDNPRKIVLWEYFNRDAIIDDLLKTMKTPN